MSSAFRPNRFVTRLLAALCAVMALSAAALVIDAPRPASAGHPPECTVNDLGMLGADASAELAAVGTWTTEDCDSRFALTAMRIPTGSSTPRVTGSEST